MGKKYDRLANYAKIKGLTLAKISREVGISSGLLSKGAKDNADISDSVCLKVSEYFTDLNKKWLMTGQGEMLTTSPPPPTIHSAGDVAMYNSQINHDNLAATLQRLTDEIAEQRRTYTELLAAKDAQIAQKDAQIDQLLKIISK